MPDSKTQLALIQQDVRISKEHTSEQLKDLKNFLNTRLNEVVEHQKKTNGRVTKNTVWRERSIGALILPNLIAVPVAVYLSILIIQRAFENL